MLNFNIKHGSFLFINLNSLSQAMIELKSKFQVSKYELYNSTFL